MADRRFVIAYRLGSGESAWGARSFNNCGYRRNRKLSFTVDCLRPMTEKMARRALSQMPYDSAQIFELIPTPSLSESEE